MRTMQSMTVAGCDMWTISTLEFHCSWLFLAVFHRFSASLFWAWSNNDSTVAGKVLYVAYWRTVGKIYQWHGREQYEFTHHQTVWWIPVPSQWNTVNIFIDDFYVCILVDLHGCMHSLMKLQCKYQCILCNVHLAYYSVITGISSSY